jgi:integrase/recombinase XerD
MHKDLNSINRNEIVREDPYNLQGRIKAVTRRIENSTVISKRNKQLIFEFCDQGSLRGLSKARILFYLNRFWNLARYVNKDFNRLNRKDIEELVGKVQNNGFSPQTVSDHLVVVKKFWKWLEGDDEEYPDKVKWIKPKRHLKNGRTKLPEQLLTREDIDKLLRAANNPRDKALISVLYESGCRIGELLTLRIQDVQLDQDGAILNVNGKTGPRRVRIIHSTPQLSNWLDHHPLRQDQAAHLWVSLGTRNHFKPLGHESTYKMLRETAQQAQIGKKCNPHLFRHSRATFLAKHLTEAQMKEYLGWTQSSEMAAVYVHLSGRDADSALLKLAGRKVSETEKESERDRQAITCSICKHENAPEMRRCTNCGRPLDLKTALEDDKREHELLNMLTPEILKEMIQKRVQQLLTTRLQTKP